MTSDKIVEIDSVKYVKRYLFGKQVLENLESQNKVVQHYIKNNTPWSTLTSDGEAFVGDTIKFEDGYKGIITNILKRDSIVANLPNYIVVLRDIHNKTKMSEIPINGRASWECTISNLYKKQNSTFF
jgi:uncharacterized protein YkvS